MQSCARKQGWQPQPVGYRLYPLYCAADSSKAICRSFRGTSPSASRKQQVVGCTCTHYKIPNTLPEAEEEQRQEGCWRGWCPQRSSRLPPSCGPAHQCLFNPGNHNITRKRSSYPGVQSNRYPGVCITLQNSRATNRWHLEVPRKSPEMQQKFSGQAQ
jgi:hypothetical protein